MIGGRGVVILSVEDVLDDTILPRLPAAGADLDCIDASRKSTVCCR
jgi:hypothetical protein